MPTITNNLTVQEWTVLYESFKMAKNPNTELLQRFFASTYTKVFTNPEREKYHQKYMHALQVKLEALTTEPSPIEKTMTRSQLYLTDSPLWAVDMRPRDIIEILAAVHWLKSYGSDKQILNMFDDIIDFNGNVNYPRLNDIYQ